ncbi:MAG TPA: Mth938-like domain-containing protein [Stellaceae bacterium]|nr:Mth938-like domain-containing protein [Stellaceae bacterium]
MDITPSVAPDSQVIEAYGPGGFRVSGIAYAGAVIVCPDTTVAWPVGAMQDVTVESLAPLIPRAGTELAIEILLLGCGRHMAPVPSALRTELRRIGIVIDAMDTGAACRTYDVLLTEGRRVAAALLPPL